MIWLKSPLFWKTVGIYLLLSALALGGLIVTLSQTPGDAGSQQSQPDSSVKPPILKREGEHAVRGAVVAWVCGTACLVFVAVTIVSPVRLLLQIVTSREDSLERRQLLSRLGERGDEFGAIAESLTGHELEQQQNLSDEREQNLDIRSTATQLSAILQTMADGVIAVDRDERVLFANQVAGRLLDIDITDIEGRPLFEVVRTRHLLDAVRETLTDGDEVMVEFHVPQRDTYLSLVVSPGAENAAVLLLRDNTEARRLETMRRDFVSGVSHELKTPLTVIQACTETLLEGDVDDLETRRKFLQQIDEQSERLLQLILGMLQLARAESGAHVLAQEPVDLQEVVMTTLRGLRPVAEGRDITLTVEGLDELFVLGDFAALQTVAGSIVDNAIKYTPDGGWVKIELASDSEALILRVADNGIGIPLKDQVRVFERFYRVDRDRNRDRGGTGLGLAIVKHLCQAMQADIALDSDTGRGCIIEVRFPADVSDADNT